MVNNKIQFNRILIDRLPLRKYITGSGKEGAGFDPRSFSPIIEELVALSVFEIIIPKSSVATPFIEDLPEIFQKKIKIVDDNGVLNTRNALFEPLCEEFNLKLSNYSISTPKTNPELLKNLSRLFQYLYFFLLALETKSQLDNSLLEIKKYTKQLRSISKSSDSKAILASIEGIMNTYQTCQIDSLILKSNAKPDLVLAFKELLVNTEYQLLSKSAQNLGRPKRTKKTIAKIRKLIYSILKKEPFSTIWTLGSKSIEIATSIPTLNSTQVTNLIAENYLPPLVPIREYIDDAMIEYEIKNKAKKKPPWTTG